MTAPRESVPELRTRVATTLHLGLPSPPPGMSSGEWQSRVQQLADWVHQEYEPHLATDGRGAR